MYRIIGADGQQYGPVTAEQIAQWIGERRVHAQTLTQAEGFPEWRALGAFPEFAGHFSPQVPPSIAPPGISGAAPGPGVDALAAEVFARHGQVDIGRCLSLSWDLLTRHFILIAGASFVLGLIETSVFLLAGVCTGGLYYLLLKLIRGERAEFGDAFAGFSLAFVHLFLAGLIVEILVSFGLLFCILPGIYLAVAWIFALQLVIDRKMGFWPAMELSMRVANRHWWSLFGLCLVNVLVILAGLACCGVGVYIAIPIAFGTLTVAYEDLFGRPAAPQSPANDPAGAI